jgi:mannose-6-phosphate isomerase
VTAPLFLDPAFQTRIWGGRQLAERFRYEVPDGPVGECWGVSAHPNGPSTVRSGPHAGRPLADVWEDDPEFFGGHADGPFPLLVKFLDARDWLSVQVHPDDAEAAELEGTPGGKAECWYVVAAEPGAELVLGHTAATKAELVAMVDAGRWEELLVRRPVRAGDFVHVPTGTVHAVGPGVLVCEVQQTCDTTYRVWDFDRRDDDGNLRELHLDKAKRVLKAPYDPGTTQTAGEPVDCPGGRRRSLVRAAHFEVTLHEVTGAGYRATFPSYELLTVTDGAGSMAWDSEEHPLRAGDHVVLPADAGDVAFAGQLTVVSSRPRGR